MKIRSSGILLPVFSLPSDFGIGDMGPGAYAFVDFLKETGQRVWQMLPLNPTSPAHGHSPYHSASAYALNPLLISPEIMVDDGLLEKKLIANPPLFRTDRVVYSRVLKYKEKLFKSAFAAFKRSGRQPEYDTFITENAAWLDDFALFTVLKNRFNNDDWNTWSEDLRKRDSKALKRNTAQFAEEIDGIKFLQFVAFTQWRRLKAYGNKRLVHIFGDIPIYVPYESADVWSNTDIFKLDSENRPYVVSGVPPDYFSKTGQRWGHPVYRWDALKKSGFSWWLDRMAHNLSLFDLVRIDHFRGLVACWEIPANEKTAVNGHWVSLPVRTFFDHLMRRFIAPPIIAEDLGVITPDVREIMHNYSFAGMRLLVFGFSNDLSENPNAFHNIPQNAVAYTGTHDTNTVRGWFKTELSKKDKERLFTYIGRRTTEKDVSWELVRLAMMSRANLTVIPMQDLLGLGEDARLNRPAKSRSNWQWRLSKTQMASFTRNRLKEIAVIYGRA
ncbi:MAG: 4-alpha-glucanotransferase [Desulfobacterales bacterium]